MVAAVVFLADGTEEMEFTITVDVLRRAQVDVHVVGVDLAQPYALCSRGVKIIPDVTLSDAIDWTKYELAVIPGGLKGAETLRGNKSVLDVLASFYSQKKYVGFICAGTTAAKAAGIGKDQLATSYPAFKGELEDYYDYSEERVVVDGTLVTSRGPGTAFLFALTLVELLVDKEVAYKLKQEMLTSDPL
ncbi:DJ-1 protein [Hesseltinella vesiculosa]|uniref:D-lactate dehydratase n=1 Tax=Hesseltinella vesiculosa TaxID=101127 RepID=A0A1X2GKW6_9FUNG|nr:DJ-1 protein [Hesseltinella vesiculosa]